MTIFFDIYLHSPLEPDHLTLILLHVSAILTFQRNNIHSNSREKIQTSRARADIRQTLFREAIKLFHFWNCCKRWTRQYQFRGEGSESPFWPKQGDIWDFQSVLLTTMPRSAETAADGYNVLPQRILDLSLYSILNNMWLQIKLVMQTHLLPPNFEMWKYWLS